MKITEEIYNRYRAFSWPRHSVSEGGEKVSLPDGFYLFVDESGKGVLGVAKVEKDRSRLIVEGMGHSTSWGIVTITHHSPAEKVRVLTHLLRRLNTEVELIVSGETEWKMDFGGLEINIPHLLKADWWRDLTYKNDFKSLLVELEMSEETLKSILTEIKNLEFSHVRFFYSPRKGLYVP